MVVVSNFRLIHPLLVKHFAENTFEGSLNSSGCTEEKSQVITGLFLHSLAMTGRH